MKRAALALLFALGCALSAPDEFAEVVEGRLEASDARLDDGTPYDAFEFQARRGQRLTAVLSSEDFDPMLHLLREGDARLASNDDARFGVAEAKIDEAIPADGTYKLLLMANEGRGLGAYRLKVTLSTP